MNVRNRGKGAGFKLTDVVLKVKQAQSQRVIDFTLT